jgi:hypothetical protein
MGGDGGSFTHIKGARAERQGVRAVVPLETLRHNPAAAAGPHRRLRTRQTVQQGVHPQMSAGQEQDARGGPAH